MFFNILALSSSLAITWNFFETADRNLTDYAMT